MKGVYKLQINITGKHLDLTPAIKQYVQEKVSKVEKNFHPILDIHVIICVEKYNHIVEIVLKTNVSTVRVKGESKDMYASIDLTVDKLIRHLRRVKEKLKEHHKHCEPKMDNMFLLDESADEEKDDIPSIFIKEIEEKPMDIEEAKLQLDALQYAFLMFKHLDTNRTNVIYKSKDGDYVVLAPENKKQ